MNPNLNNIVPSVNVRESFLRWMMMVILIANLEIQSCPAQTDSGGVPSVPPSFQVQTSYVRGASAKIPFEMVGNEIVVTATINGFANLKLIVDTGVVNSVLDQGSVVGASFPRSPGSYQVRGIGDEVLRGQVSQNLKMTMSGMTASGISFLIVSGTSVLTPLSVHVDGVLGYDILKNYVVKIDYINSTIELSDSMPADTASIGTPVPITIENGRILVTGVVYNNKVGSAPTPLLMDTGCSIGMVLSRRFLQDNPRVTFPGGVERQMSGIGGPLIMLAVPCSELRLGNIALMDPYVHLMEQDAAGSPPFTGFIGNQIWKRFNVTLDYPGKRLFLKDNGLNDGSVRYLRPAGY